MKRYLSILILFVFIILSPDAKAFEIRGHIKNAADSTYACFSYIHSRDDFFILGHDMVIQKVKVEKDGSFLIKGDELPKSMRFYRLSFSEGKRMIRYTLGKDRNNLTLYMNNKTKVSVNISMHDFLIGDVVLQADNKICGMLKDIDDELQFIINDLFEDIPAGQKDVVRSKVVEHIESYLDNCDLSVIHYYMYAYSLGYSLQSDYLDDKLIYSKMEDQEPNSIYTKELAYKLGIESNSTPWYVWVIIIILFFYSLGLSFFYFVRERQPVSKSEIILTLKEKEVLRLIASGKLNKEIAEELSVETSTIKTHVSNLYKKIGVTKRSEAVAYYKKGID